MTYGNFCRITISPYRIFFQFHCADLPSQREAFRQLTEAIPRMSRAFDKTHKLWITYPEWEEAIRAWATRCFPDTAIHIEHTLVDQTAAPTPVKQHRGRRQVRLL